MSSPASGLNRASLLGVGVLLVLATAIISGLSTFLNSYAVQGTNSDAFVTARNGMVALFVLPAGWFAWRSSRTRLRAVDWGRLALIGLIGGAVPFVLFFRGLELATAAHGSLTASFVYRTLFLMATVFGVVFLSERFRWRIGLAAALLLIGNVLLLSLTTPIWGVGSDYVFAATALWAAEYTISRWTLRDLRSGTVALGRMGFGAVFLLVYLAATAQVSAIGAFTLGQWEWVLISAALLTGFVLTWYAGLRRVDLGVATAVLVLGFPVSWTLSVVIRNAAYTTYAPIGALLIAVGAAVVLGRQSFGATWEYLRSLALRRPTA